MEPQRLMEPFYCNKMRCDGISPKQCITRQLKRVRSGRNLLVPEYSACSPCSQGKDVITQFPKIYDEIKKGIKTLKDDVTIICEWCGAEKKLPHFRKKERFCSTSCGSQWWAANRPKE